MGWLFPRCACTVHHGGSGTTAAALRAGKPTVITPVFLDQFDHAEMVSRLGVGVGTRQLQKVSVSVLAAAITRVCTNAAMETRAAALGQQLMGEDGVAAAVGAINEAIYLHED